jgi:hypothetical protein
MLSFHQAHQASKNYYQLMQMAYLINQLMVISIHFQANYLKGKNHQTLKSLWQDLISAMKWAEFAYKQAYFPRTTVPFESYVLFQFLQLLLERSKVARIDRETLQLEHAIENLNGANHIRPHSKGYMLSNSRKGETHIYDRNFQLLEIIDGTNSLFPVKWVQDTVEQPSGSHLIADCNTFNLRERTADGKERKFNTQMPNRIFQIEPVSNDFSFNQQAHSHFTKN